MCRAQEFAKFFRTHRGADGSSWTGADIERATHGHVSSFYVSRLERGRIKDPSFARIVAISRVMRIPLHTWFEVEFEYSGE